MSAERSRVYVAWRWPIVAVAAMFVWLFVYVRRRLNEP